MRPPDVRVFSGGHRIRLVIVRPVLDSKIRGAWDRVMRPVGATLGRTRVHPDVITILGVVVQGGAAYLIIEGRFVPAGFVAIGAALADVLDGAVAKSRGMTSRFGSLLDATTDRLTDALFFIPIAWLYGVSPDTAAHDEPWVAAVSLSALVGSFLVSYIRAKAESLGFDCKVGLAERAERVIVLILGLILGVVPMAVLLVAAATAITSVQRLAHVRRQAKGA